MFTGIIEEVGKIIQREEIAGGIRLGIEANIIMSDLKPGDSVSVEGVCQTVVERNANRFFVEAVGETLEKTTLGMLTVGSPVNLERPLMPQSRLGGHFVQGHANGVGVIRQFFPRGENYFLEVEIPEELRRYVIPEGSIAIDGISLTVATLKGNRVGINIIPFTASHTSLRNKKSGDKVNIEVDMIAKYIEKLLGNINHSELTEEKLKKWGYGESGNA